MTDAVLLLLLAGILMLLNHAVCIVIDGRTGNNARLRTAVHNQLINIIALLGIGHIRAVCLAGVEKLLRFRIDTGIIRVHIVGEIALRAVDIEERERILQSRLLRLRTVVNIVRQSRNTRSKFLCRTDTDKRFYISHGFLSP